MLNKHNLKILLSDIRFWIILLFLIRLIGITNAPLETGHNWRQSLTNMIARNFLEGEANLLYPRIDMAGAKSGIIGSEFPVFNYLIYLVSSVFGYAHWYGRLINLLISSIGVLYFFKLLKGLFNKHIAFNATIVLLVSIWFSFSRKVMPDTFSVSMVIISLYYAYCYLRSGNIFSLMLFFMLSTLGVLAKIPSLALLSLLIIPLMVKWQRNLKLLVLYIAWIVSFIFVAWWYFHWVPHLVEEYQYALFFPKSLAEGLVEVARLAPEALEKFYFSSFHSYIGFLCFLTGLYFVFTDKNKAIKIGFAIVTLVFLVFIIKTGSVFPKHNYYIIPYTPVMAVIAGVFISKVPKKYQVVLLILIGLEGIANQQHDFFIKKNKRYLLNLEQIVEKHVNENELIVTNGGPSPQQMYFTHRKGWSVDDSVLRNRQKINEFTKKGAKHIVVDRATFKTKLEYPVEYSGENFVIYSLD